MSEDIRDRIRTALDAYAEQLASTEQPVWTGPAPTKTSWARRWAAPVAAAVLAAALIGGGAVVRSRSTNHRVASPAMSDAVRDKLAAIARATADGNGDPGPVSASAVLTTKSRTAQYFETGGGSDSVWAIQIRGEFVCGGCKVPPGAKTPTGRVITLVLDADASADGESNFSIGGNQAALSLLGAPVVLPVPAISAAVGEKLAALGREAADRNGDTGPVTAAAVLTTRSMAEQYLEPGDGITGEDSVWVLQIRGNFVCGGCRVPPGSTTPTGRLMTLLLDAHTYAQTDVGFGGAEPDLSKLGDPVIVPVPAVSSAVQAKLSTVARAQADANGDKATITASAVLTTPQQAASATGARAGNAAGLVWLIQVIGDFSCKANCFAALPQPHGTVIALTLDQSYNVLGFQISDQKKNLSALGTSFALKP